MCGWFVGYDILALFRFGLGLRVLGFRVSGGGLLSFILRNLVIDFMCKDSRR